MIARLVLCGACKNPVAGGHEQVVCEQCYERFCDQDCYDSPDHGCPGFEKRIERWRDA